jgi:asparagine synthase (glutamine-hydrolysing)
MEQANLIERVLAHDLTYLERAALIDLAKAVSELRHNNVNGILVETGCALGGSALVMTFAKQKEQPLFVFDVFGIIPPPSQHDGEDVHQRYKAIVSGSSVGIGDGTYYGYQSDLLNKVKRTFAEFDLPIDKNAVHFIQGLYSDTLSIDQPIALAHIDCDWYESVLVCLERIEPNLTSGGRLVIDDYYTWSGCRAAVDFYFRDKLDQFEFIKKSRLHIIKK